MAAKMSTSESPSRASEHCTWGDYRAGSFYNNFGMRIDHLLVTTSLTHRVVWAESITRHGRKNRYPQTTHRWSIAQATRSMPAGLRRSRALRYASASDESDLSVSSRLT